MMIAGPGADEGRISMKPESQMYLYNIQYAVGRLGEITDGKTFADYEEDDMLRANDESLTSTATAAVTTSPLTVSLDNEPDSHDGQNTFTFELRFSEHFPLGHATLKDAFAVDGGEVTKANRKTKGDNTLWVIMVRPEVNAT